MAFRINSLVKFYTLILLREDKRHGYELIKELKEKLDRGISPSQVYPFLGLLETKGFVSSRVVGKRDKKLYLLTSKGIDFVDGLLSRFGEVAQLAIASKIVSCANCGCKVYGPAYSEVRSGKKVSFCCRSCAGKTYK